MGRSVTHRGTVLRTPRPVKRNAPAPILLLDQDQPLPEPMFDSKPVSPPISESPPLSHNPVFKANAPFFERLKERFFKSDWSYGVGTILESKRRLGFVFMVLERVVTPPEYFFCWCVEFFFQEDHMGFDQLLFRMKTLCQGVWDDGLIKYVKAFHTVASSFSQESGLGPNSPGGVRKTPDVPDLKWEAVVRSQKQAEKPPQLALPPSVHIPRTPTPTNAMTPKRKRRSMRSASKKRRYLEDVKRFEFVRQQLLKDWNMQKRRKMSRSVLSGSTSANTNIAQMLV